MSLYREFTRGILRENPIFKLALGMCPTLAVTTSLENGLGMGLASTFVLLCSNLVISLLRRLIPDKVRIPCYIVIIATFVTVVQLLMQAYTPALSESLGLFIPLIVVNCIILGRAEAYASRNPVARSLADGLGMGIGFTLGLALLAACRELAGQGSLTLWGSLELVNLQSANPVILAILPPGGFVALGLLLALINHAAASRARRRGLPPPEPTSHDCRNCLLCKPAARAT